MIRGLPTTILCACLAGAVGIGLFFIKHEVKEQEARLGELNQEIQNNQEAMHVLKAEWSYLNDPARLRALSEKHLAMKVMGPSQIASLDTLPAGAATYAAARPTQSAPTRAEAAPVAVAHAAPAPAPAKTVVAPAGKPAIEQAGKTDQPARPAAKAPIAVASTKPAAPVLVPGADTTPRLAAAPAPLPAPSTAVQRGPAAPARNIVIQSPALASTPALPGEVR